MSLFKVSNNNASRLKPITNLNGKQILERDVQHIFEGYIQAALQKGEPRATKAYRVMRAYEDLRKSGRSLKEEAEQLDFERQLRKDGIGILGKNVQLPDDIHTH